VNDVRWNGAELAAFPSTGHVADVEHPAGHIEVGVELDVAADPPRVISAGVIRTARKLFDGTVFPAWGLATIPSFHTHGTPPVAGVS
jgi:4-oxalomesaconate tautomerase